uniref:Uncharacterized protein n=1 Tax=Pygocentrus nattereri TaxID=42514 RepID=A0A3B4DQ97_PYGNA
MSTYNKQNRCTRVCEWSSGAVGSTYHFKQVPPSFLLKSIYIMQCSVSEKLGLVINKFSLTCYTENSTDPLNFFLSFCKHGLIPNLMPETHSQKFGSGACLPLGYISFPFTSTYLYLGNEDIQIFGFTSFSWKLLVHASLFASPV